MEQSKIIDTLETYRTPTDAAGIRAHEEALALEVLEHNLEREQLEVMERRVASAEDALASREARIQLEVDQKVAGIHKALIEEYRRKLGLQETRFKQWQVELQGKADALKVELVAVERHGKAAEEARVTAEAELSSLQ